MGIGEITASIILGTIVLVALTTYVREKIKESVKEKQKITNLVNAQPSTNEKLGKAIAENEKEICLIKEWKTNYIEETFAIRQQFFDALMIESY